MNFTEEPGLRLPRELAGRLIRFGVSGVTAALCYAVLAMVFAQAMGAAAAVANAAAYALATVVSYLLQTLWSFSRPLSRQNFQRFIVVAVLGATLAAGIGHATDLAGLDYRFGIVTVLLTVPPLTFAIHHFWTYR